MSGATVAADVEVPVSERGPSPRKVIVGYGFWLFLLSDIILFSALFAAYAVLAGRTAGGPSGVQLFHRHTVLVETGCLLLSSFACAMMSLAIEMRRRGWMVVGAVATFLLGAAFLGLELGEFASMIERGAGPTAARSSRPSSRWWACTACTSRSASPGSPRWWRRCSRWDGARW